ncbi:MAG: hypothetical protein Q4A37_01590 [Candidatus Saccharibacteria bacterium]|nr:hypothetical protein [Candidatus Saccharibacteria bacterium]
MSGSSVNNKKTCVVAGSLQLLISIGAILIIGPTAIEAVYREFVLQSPGKLPEVGKAIAIALVLLLLNAVVAMLASSAMIYVSKKRTRLLCAIWPLMFIMPLPLIFVVLIYALLSVPMPVLTLAWVCVTFISFQGAKAYRRICRQAVCT